MTDVRKNKFVTSAIAARAIADVFLGTSEKRLEHHKWIKAQICLEMVSKPQIRFKGKAQADRESAAYMGM
jgi:hypothetical protein